ncbi:pentapeptide repeat-containing protein [Streptomyces sp. TRM68367]|uniref:pentapeptide repeat-containing protein n=1 Tax=Streptomyces sp. TRM68367 TaxID=2758415 RepID=UPI00165BBF81|nr:pentapeptide repeat-containing protein [Streptomyces sp. TRM68367]MBC9729673.1 pentapeptide repeat-containing protein [Streptomyces sp. TRM68367]
MAATTDPETGRPILGPANFSWATFTDGADFAWTTFTDRADFTSTTFTDGADFTSTTFERGVDFSPHRYHGYSPYRPGTFKGDDVSFRSATFHQWSDFTDTRFWDADFSLATFNQGANFTSAEFYGHARFNSTFEGAAWFRRGKFTFANFAHATFRGDTVFESASFRGDAEFGGSTFADRIVFTAVHFEQNALFTSAIFEGTAKSLGPLTCRYLGLDSAVFATGVTIAAAAETVSCTHTQWESTATLRLRYSKVDLSNAILTNPVAVIAHPTRFTVGIQDFSDGVLSGDATVQLISLHGVDAGHLVLNDISLVNCRFSGAFNLDQLRIEGTCTFLRTPQGWRRHFLWPQRWTSRDTLAEEHHWRALPTTSLSPHPDWKEGPHHPDSDLTADPGDLAATYRQLRKGFEDAKNEPDAADFYYGEMEMRRHDRNRPHSERVLLTSYWFVSGYGLRASRALGCLVVSMCLTVMLLMLVGMPSHAPSPRTRGSVTAGQAIDVTTETPGPGGAAPGPMDERFTSERAEMAWRTALNSVLFRSAGQDLTRVGIYIEMTSRLVEPALLALALLAVRGRVKR